MSDIQPTQIVIILIFLGALFAAQVIIKRLMMTWTANRAPRNISMITI